MVSHSLLVLPIHLHPYDEYYAGHEPLVQSQWWPPPWMFNDIIGFLDVGLDGVGRIKGDTYLKRMHWRLEALKQLGQGRGSGAASGVLRWCETQTREIDSRDDGSCTTACREAVEEAEVFVRRAGKGTRKASVWLPAYPLACIDFSRAIEAIGAQERQRGEP